MAQRHFSLFCMLMLMISACSVQRNSLCPDPETSAKPEKFRQKPFAYRNLKGNAVPLKAIASSGSEQNAFQDKPTYLASAIESENSRIADLSGVEWLQESEKEPVMTVTKKSNATIISKPTKEEKAQVASLIKSIKTAQQLPEDIHYATKRKALFSTVLGLAAPVLGAVFPLFFLVGIVLGFTLGITALRTYRTLDNQEGRGFALFGTILNAVWLAFMILVIAIVFFIFVAWAGG